MAQSGSYFPIGVSISNHEGSLTNSLLDVLPLVEFAGKSPYDRFDGLTCRQRPYPREPVARTRESRLKLKRAFTVAHAKLLHDQLCLHSGVDLPRFPVTELFRQLNPTHVLHLPVSCRGSGRSKVRDA